MQQESNIFTSSQFFSRDYKHYIKHLCEIIGITPNYFIATDCKESDIQPDLKKFLYNNFTVKTKNDSYVISNMSKMSYPDKIPSSK